jgi:hypothetical protein
VCGRSTADAYNDAIQTALEDNADFLLTVEDDTFPPDDGFFKLLQRYREIGDPKVVLGGYYVKKQENREGVHIQIVGGKRQALTLSNKDVGVYEVYTIAQGFTLFPMECFLQTMRFTEYCKNLASAESVENGLSAQLVMLSVLFSNRS